MKPTGPGQSTHLLLEVVALLDVSSIDYAVIGALAAAVHGVVRASVDADAVVQVTAAKLSELQATLTDHGLTVELRRGDFDDPIPAMLQVTDEFGNRVDLLAGLRGLDAGVYARAIRIPFEGTQLQVVGREDFIAMKAFAGGPGFGRCAPGNGRKPRIAGYRSFAAAGRAVRQRSLADLQAFARHRRLT